MAAGMNKSLPNITSGVGVPEVICTDDLQSAKIVAPIPNELVGGEAATPSTDGAKAKKSLTASEPATNVASETLYFFEDQVFRINKKGHVKFGLVVETADSFSDEEDEEDAPDIGEIRVAWHPDGKEELVPEVSVGLADRTLMPSDVVRRVNAREGTQLGYIREMQLKADVRIVGANYIIQSVDADRFRATRIFHPDTPVCFDSWVGSVKSVDETIRLRSSYGAKFEVSSCGLYDFKDVNKNSRYGIFENSNYYPSQILSGRLSLLEPVTLLTPEIPLKKNKKGKYASGRYTVEAVSTESVWVRWQCRALFNDAEEKSTEMQPPKTCIVGEDLKRLYRINLFESSMQQINDRNYVKISGNDFIVRKSDWEKQQDAKYQLLQKEQQEEQASNKNMNLANMASGVSTSGAAGHHYEKHKKKQHLDTDKSQKSKKSVNKLEKKEKSQVAESKIESNPIASKSESSVIAENVPEAKSSLSDWISDDEEGDATIGGSGESLLCDGQETKSTVTKISSCSTPTSRSSPKLTNRWQRCKQIRKKFKKLSSLKLTQDKLPKVGSEVLTESLIVYGIATVVWQDGTVESGIPSTKLYPIHQLDTHEFFPGDFVIIPKVGDTTYRDYGVVVHVDRGGRIARVKWFTTYRADEEPIPTEKTISEVSVYDLKDHPDFQYRPGVMVIRVANFGGGDSKSYAGQVVDNYADGHVQVRWVDGHTSMCWPQDLFEVGQYENSDGDGTDSDDSWETESENSEYGCNSPKLTISGSHILMNLENTCGAIARVEECLTEFPALQTLEVVNILLVVYKGCRYFDRMLNTTFFHEDYFTGLVERVRRKNAQSNAERLQERKNRLFNEPQQVAAAKQSSRVCDSCQAEVMANVGNKTSSDCASEMDSPKVLLNIALPLKSTNSSTSVKRNEGIATATSELNTIPTTPLNDEHSVEDSKPKVDQRTTEANAGAISVNFVDGETAESLLIATADGDDLDKVNTATINRLLSSAIHNIEKAFEKTNQVKSSFIEGPSSQDDSGNYSRCENNDGSTNSYTSFSDQVSMSCNSIELAADLEPRTVCGRFCSLLKAQLLKCLSDIRAKNQKGENLNLSEVLKFVMEAEKTGEDDCGAEAEEKEPNKEVVVKEPEIADHAVEDNNEIPTASSSPDTMEKEKIATVEMPPSTTIDSLLSTHSKNFQVLPSAPKTHKFYYAKLQPTNEKQYYKAIYREHCVLKSSLPPGVWVRVFEDRMDLISVMMEGPRKTPYEDGLFFFHIQLGQDYPKKPPVCHYVSYCSERLNPNLYEDGKVCVSLLGTWSGRDTETWGPKSSLLQVIVSIQGLILVDEPYYNEAGYEKYKGSQQGIVNSRMYNEMAIIKLVQATMKLLQSPPDIFCEEIKEYYKLNGQNMYQRLKGWTESSNPSMEAENNVDGAGSLDCVLPEFPLMPASRGFCISLATLLESFKSVLASFDTVKNGSDIMKSAEAEL